MITPADVLYMEDGGPKRCDRCIHYILEDGKPRGQCELFRQSARVSGADGVCGLYVNGDPKIARTQPITFAGLDPTVAGYGEDAGMGGYSCGNCKYGGKRWCRHPALDEPVIDNIGGCCNIWDYRRN